MATDGHRRDDDEARGHFLRARELLVAYLRHLETCDTCRTFEENPLKPLWQCGVGDALKQQRAQAQYAGWMAQMAHPLTRKLARQDSAEGMKLAMLERRSLAALPAPNLWPIGSERPTRRPPTNRRPDRRR